MKAAIMSEPFHIGFQDIPVPTPKSNEVLIQMVAAGICGSDIHFYDGTHPYAKYPQIFGHELSGKIVEIGSEVSGYKIGDRVVVEPGVPCGTCYPCRIGKYNCCTNIDMIGVFRPGGFAEFLTVPANCVHRLPDEMSYELGALCEPFTIGAQIVSRADSRPGSTVTILGMGPIGLTVLILLKKLHHVNVFAVDVVEERLELARLFGADEILNARDQDTLATIHKWTGGEGSNIVIESAGLPMTIEQSIHLVSPGGRIVIAGLTNKDVSFPGVLFTNKEVEIYGSRNNAGKFPEIIRFLNEHQAEANAFITRQMPFEHIAEALELAKKKPHQVTKIILQYK